MASEESKQQRNLDALPCGDLMAANAAISQSTLDSVKKNKGSALREDAPEQRSVEPNLSQKMVTVLDTHDSSAEDKKTTTPQVKVVAADISIERQSLNNKNNKIRIEQQQQQQPKQLSQLIQQQHPISQAPSAGTSFAKGRNLPQNSRTSTSIQQMGTNYLNTVSQSNISINTSTYKRTDDEEGDLHFTSEDDEEKFNTANQVDHVDKCYNERFYKYKDCISKSKYRTIHRGYDNESGCEIAWTTYRLHNDQRERLLKALDRFKALGQSPESQNRNILRVFYNEVRTSAPTTVTTNKPKSSTSITQPAASVHEELVVVSELITGGSIREYLKKIYSSLRVNVIRSWCQKVLNALQYLHENNIVHGELSCESIYINSNNGEIKVGDVGIKHIHTSDTSHELGASVIYRKQKMTRKVDIFCLGLTLLEIVTASETGPSRSTLRYIIRIIKLGRKRDMLATLKHDSMRDFMEKALEEDPEKRYSAQQLLQHPFITQGNKNAMKLSEGLAVLIKEQVTYFKNQRNHNKTKTSNSLHLSVLNDSSQKKQLAQQETQKTASQFVEQQSNPAPHQEEHKGGVMKKDQEIQSETADAKQAIAQPLLTKPALIKTGSLLTDLRVNSPRASESSMTKKPPSEVAVVEPPQQPVSEQKIRSTSKWRGRTMSYLELPANRQKQLQIGTPKKKLRKQNPNVQATRQISGKVQACRPKAGGSATVYPSRNRSKISGARSRHHSLSNDLQKSGKETSGGAVEILPEEQLNQQRNLEPLSNQDFQIAPKYSQEPYCFEQNKYYAEVPSSPLTFKQSEASRNGGIQQDLQMSVASPELTASENCLFFRIQIVMKGRKSDVKFPFDLQKDTPEAVVNELQDYFLHSSDQMELPAHAVRIVQLEIQRGIDCHYQSQQQMIMTEGGSQTQTQSSYQNKVVISMGEQQKAPTKRRRMKAVAKPAMIAEETKIWQEDEDQRAAAEVEKEAKRQLIEDAAQKREQMEVDQRLAHDYLSMVPLFDTVIYSRSLSLPSCTSPDETSFEQTAASLQAEMNQMLKDGLLNEQEYFRRMQEQAVRKLSISQNSAEQRRFLLAETGNPRIYEPQEMEELEIGNSAAVIEFEPQIPHNNTTGERHEKLIEEQQKNGPFGQQELLHYRNSQDCKDKDLINFMHNPDEDEHRDLKEARRNKDRRAKENNSAKSEAQESLWLLRELFPGYMEKYQEDYENNQVHMIATYTQHHSSLVDLSQYTIDLSYASLLEGSHLSDFQKDQSQAPSEPFNVNISVILPVSFPGQQLSLVPIENTHQEDQSKPEVVSGTQVAGDSSSQQLQIPSDLDEAQHQKQFAQQRASAKNVNHRSFLQDCSESFFMALGNNTSVCFNHPANLHKLNKKDQLPATRPPSGQALHFMPHLQEGIKRPKKLNNSQHYTQVVSFPHGIAGSTNQMQSFHSHLDPQKQQMMVQNAQRTPLTGCITEMPDAVGEHGNPTDINPSSASGGGLLNALSNNKTTFDVQLSSQISDSQNSNRATHKVCKACRHPRLSEVTSTKVQHAITYSKDQGQIQVISSSLETSTNQNPIGPVPEASLEQDSQDHQCDSALLLQDACHSPLELLANHQPSINNIKVYAAQQNKKEVSHDILLLNKHTPSVMDIDRANSNPSTGTFEAQVAQFGDHQQQSKQKNIQTLIIIKAFPNLIENACFDEEVKQVQITSNDQTSSAAATRHVGIESSIMPSQQMRLKSNAVTNAPLCKQDLERLFQIRQRGMHSEKLDKGFKKMFVTDVANLKFALKMLGALPAAKSEDSSLLMDKSQISNSERAGHYDSTTRSVTRRLKKQEGLSVDSTVDHDTFDKIIDLAIQHLTRLDLESVQEQEEDLAQVPETTEEPVYLGFNQFNDVKQEQMMFDEPSTSSIGKSSNLAHVTTVKKEIGITSQMNGRSVIGRFKLHAQNDNTPENANANANNSSCFGPTEQNQSDFSAKAAINYSSATRREKFKLKKASSMYEMGAASNIMLLGMGKGQILNSDPNSNIIVDLSTENTNIAEETTPKFVHAASSVSQTQEQEMAEESRQYYLNDQS